LVQNQANLSDFHSNLWVLVHFGLIFTQTPMQASGFAQNQVVFMIFKQNWGILPQFSQNPYESLDFGQIWFNFYVGQKCPTSCSNFWAILC
jgi:hypothetical protein